MAKWPLLACAALAIISGACRNGATAPSPTPSPAGTVAIRGTVTDQRGAPLAAATLAVMDGPNIGRAAASNAQGEFALTGLQPGALTMQISATGYAKVIAPIALTTDTTMNFQLGLLLAEFTTPNNRLAIVGNANGTFSAVGDLKNTGQGCAADLSAAGTILDDNQQTIATFSWSMPPNQILTPGDIYRFELCCFPADRASAVRSYTGVLKWNTVRCP